MATYNNDLRLKEITTGDEDGTWGTSTNTNLSLIADAFGLGTKQLAADANETFTIPDATVDGTRALYLRITSAVTLTATRTVTLAPNTVSKVWIIENATTGGQIITIAQGSGATVNVPNGSKVVIVTDGAGAGAAVFNANPTTTSGTVTSVGGTGTVNGITLTGTVTSSGNLTLGGTLSNVSLTTQVTGTLPVGNGGTGATTLTANNVILGNGTSAPLFVAPGTSGNVLTSNGTTWTSSTPAAGLTGQTDSASPFETALGSGAGAVNTGVNNTFIGFEAGNDNTTATTNVFVGYQAGDAVTTASSNTLVGASAGGSLTVGGNNTALGRSALDSTSGTASQNTVIGDSALGASGGATPASNVVIGFGACANTNGNITSNVIIGHQAGSTFDFFEFANSTQNVVVGALAGTSMFGNNNIVIGYDAEPAANSDSNTITLGNGSIATFRIPGIGLTWTSSGLPVANGGTGATTLTGVLKGNGTSAFTAGTVALGSEVSGTLPVANGGTGLSTLGTAGQVLTVNSGATALEFAALPASGGMTLLATLTPANGVSTASVTGIAPQKSIYVLTLGTVTLSGTGGLKVALSDNNGSTYSGVEITFTNTNGNTPRGMIQYFGTELSSSAKPYLVNNPSDVSSFSIAADPTGVINALQIGTTAGRTFTGTGTLYVYGVK
jgi:hypothetical protein